MAFKIRLISNNMPVLCFQHLQTLNLSDTSLVLGSFPQCEEQLEIILLFIRRHQNRLQHCPVNFSKYRKQADLLSKLVRMHKCYSCNLSALVSFQLSYAALVVA